MLAAACVAALFVAVLVRRGNKRACSKDWPVNLAHRGASARWPENTLEAFRAAGSSTCGLELDVHVTRDGSVVVVHDETVDRTTNGTGAVREMDLAEVRALDAGYRFTPDMGLSYPYRGLEHRVPTLDEVFRRFPDSAVNIDIKEALSGAEAAVLRVIERCGAEGRSLVASQNHGVIRRFRRLSGGRVSTSASKLEIGAFYLLSRLRLQWLLRPAYDALQVPVAHRGIRIVTPRFVAAAHERGVRVDVWTIDDPGDMRRLLDLGVDVIMTNRPELLEQVLQERYRLQDRRVQEAGGENRQGYRSDAEERVGDAQG